MTDNKITREMTFSEELPYFKERMKEIFDNFDNPDGYADITYLSALSDSSRIVRKAEEEIKRQKAEIEQLKFEIAKLLPKGCPYAIQVEASNKLEAQIKSEAIKEFAEKLKLHSYIMSDESQTGIINRYSVVTVNQIDNILKELVGNER